MTFLCFPSSYLTLHYANRLPNEAKVMLRNPRLTSVDVSTHHEVSPWRAGVLRSELEDVVSIKMLCYQSCFTVRSTLK